MSTVLNTLTMLMNFAGGQQINGSAYFVPMDQVTTKVEVTMPGQSIVEEFHVTRDRGLNLVKFDYSLDGKIPPFRTTNAYKSIVDENAGVSYHMDQSTGSCSVTVMDKNANDSPALITTTTLLRMMAPDQILTVADLMKYVRKDSSRGIDTDLWTFDVDNFYVAGYGKVNTRQTLHTLSGNITKYNRGTARTAVILQRSVFLLNGRTASSTPLVMFNYFDFFSPAAPQLFDFNIMSCQGSATRGVNLMEKKDEIQLRFSGKLPAAGYSEPEGADVANFRRLTWIQFSKVAGVSPLRSVGNFWSHDDWNTYFTTVLLPDTRQLGQLQGTGSDRTYLPNSDAIQNLKNTIELGGFVITTGSATLLVTDLRRNVSLMASTKGEKGSESFTVYKAFTTIVGKGARAVIQKLTNKQCTERCQRENRFNCQSVATCGYGDCILSDLHGDELLRSPVDGSRIVANHSHCAVWTRVWTNEYVRVPDNSFPAMDGEYTAYQGEKEETCAKQCSFTNTPYQDCESFSWCPKSATGGQSTCMLYKHHVFDLTRSAAPSPTANLKTTADTCHHYTKNYLVDFEAVPASALRDDRDFEVTDVPVYTDSQTIWRCAKACVDKLGDDKCHSIEICQDDWIENMRCRISTGFVSVKASDMLDVNNTIPSETCKVHSRVRYLDGSPVSQRTATNPRVSKLGKRSDKTEIAIISNGYSSVQMTVLAFSMLIAGMALVVAMVVVTKKLFPARDIGFSRLII